MTEAMPFLQKYDITFLRPPAIYSGEFLFSFLPQVSGVLKHVPQQGHPPHPSRLFRLL